MLHVKNISFNYSGNTTFKGIKNISFDLPQGKMLTVLGKSGSGKSTLLKCVYGMLDLANGSITLNGEKVLGPAFNLIPGHVDMKLVSQEYYVLENNTVAENVKEMLAGYTDEYKAYRIEKVLKALELNKFADKKATELSSGQRQRLTIARALAEFPKVLLLDEPFSNLDFAKRDKLFSFVRENLKQNNSSCIFVTHHAQEAIRYADELMIMEEGRVKAFDTPEKLYHQQDSMEIAKLFGKCFPLEKKDFVAHKGVKFFGGKLICRPEDFKIVSSASKNKQLQGTIKEVFFAGAHYELKVKLHSGKMIYVYSTDNKFNSGDNLFLSLDK